MLLGEIIANYRKENNLSQRKFAERCKGISNGYISMIENNRNPKTDEPIVPSLGKLKIIAEAMEMSLEDLLNSADDMPVELPTRKLHLFDGPGSIRFSPPAPLFLTDEPPLPPDAVPATSMEMIPVIGCVRGGPGGLAREERLGVEPAQIRGRAEDYFYLKVVGDSMAPAINEGDLALVRRQDQAENGQLVVAIVKGEFNDEGVIKQYKTYPSAVSLISFNPNYEPRFFPGKEMNRITIVGKVVQTVHKWD